MDFTENLRRKSTPELKEYLSGDGYKEEAVKAAINILRERGVNIDKEVRAYQLKFCSICKLRSFDASKGIICSLTQEKAEFLESCKDYKEDPEEAKKSSKTKQYSDWGGFMYFYWFVLACGALVTIVRHIATFNLTDYSNSIMLSLADSMLLFAYSALCVYTLVAFIKKLPNAVSLGIIQNLTLIGMNGFALLGTLDGESDENVNVAQLIGSIFWAIIFLIYLYTNSRVQLILPKEKRHMLRYDKPVLWSVFIITIFLFVGGVIESAIKSQDSAVEILQEAVEEYNANLPQKNETREIRSAYINDKKLYVDYYSLTFSNEDLSSSFLSYYPIYTKELIKFAPVEFSDSLMIMCWAADYGYICRWFDINGDYTYELSFSSEDLNSMFDTIPYKTSLENMQAFVDAWNMQCPAVYLGGSAMYERAEMNPRTATIYLTLIGVDSEDLTYFTSDYLNEYFRRNWDALSDYFVTLAMLNNLDITYKLCAESSKYWSKEITFTSDEYTAF